MPPSRHSFNFFFLFDLIQMAFVIRFFYCYIVVVVVYVVAGRRCRRRRRQIDCRI